MRKIQTENFFNNKWLNTNTNADGSNRRYNNPDEQLFNCQMAQIQNTAQTGGWETWISIARQHEMTDSDLANPLDQTNRSATTVTMWIPLTSKKLDLDPTTKTVPG